MKIALLGAMGFVGQTAARDLAGRDEVRHLLLVDYDIRGAKKFGRALSPKCGWAMADVGRVPDLERLLDDVDAVANAVGPAPEYEKTVLLTCAASRRPVASIGDGIPSGADRREIHDAFRRAGVGAVSGCGLLPGWTELLGTHFLKGGRSGERGSSPGGEVRFLFCSPDRFGGYAFFRRLVREIGRPATAPPCAPAGRYFEAAEGAALGLPEGRSAGLCKGVAGGLRMFGAAGREMSAAFLFWLRRSLRPAEGTPVAAAGVCAGGTGAGPFAAISDPQGRAAGTLLAGTVLRLVGLGKGKGLLALPEIVGRQEAERIASSCNATVREGLAESP